MKKFLSYCKRRLRLTGAAAPRGSLLLFIAIGGIVLTVIWLFSSASQKELVYLTSQTLSKSDLSLVTAELDKSGSVYRINGSYILVEPHSKQNLLSRLQLGNASQQSTNADYQSAGDTSGIFLSEGERLRRWSVCREKTLASQIGNFKGINAAKVFLAGSTGRSFGSKRSGPSATVIVWTEDDQPLDLELARAIRQTISGSVSALEPADVNVVDASNGQHIPVIFASTGQIPAGEKSAIALLPMLRRSAQQMATQWEQKIQENLSYIPKLVVCVHVNPHSLIDQAKPPDESSGQGESDPRISISLNIPRSYLLSLYRATGQAEERVTDDDLEPIAFEQATKVTAMVRAMIGQPASSHVYADWYHDDSPSAEPVVADSSTASDDTQAWAYWLVDNIKLSHVGLGLAVLASAVLAVKLVRRIRDSNLRQRAVALARLNAEGRYLNSRRKQKAALPADTSVEPTPYRGPSGVEVSAFEELALLDDATLRGLLTRAQTQIIALALRTASSSLRHRILTGLSWQHRQAVHSHPDFRSPVRLSDIEAAQQELVDLLDIPEHNSPELVAEGELSAV